MKPNLDGIIVINKPSGMTSHDVVSAVRRKFRMKRVGHAGTLDPLATGVLVILLGKSTKLFHKFESFDKAYRATMKLGVRTDTSDIGGAVLEEAPHSDITKDRIEKTFTRFVGEIDQTAPMVSAVKVNGQRLYKLARKGIKVDRPVRRIRVDELKVLNFDIPQVEFYLECSKGTYVRQIAEDVGQSLECGACITQIERTKVGPFELSEAVELNDLDVRHLRRWDP